MRTNVALLKVALLLVAACAAVSAQMAKLPADIDSKSLSRLPLLSRDQLDAEGQRVYDVIIGRDQPNRSGPVGAVLYSPAVGEPFELINRAVRKSVNGTQYFEICTLIAARDFDQQYEWTAHELAAQKAGVDQKVIDAIKFNRAADGLPEKEATVIRFGRAIFKDHKVTPALYAKVVELFGKQGMIDLSVTMGDYAMTAIVLTAIDQQLAPERKPLLPDK
jgi:4-carboxymuconolactone decarboxylase